MITRNTIGYNLIFILLDIVLSVAVAIILYEIRNKVAKQLYQTVILIPFLISMVIVSYLVFAFLSNGNGYVNNTLLPWLGRESVDWYNQEKYWPWFWMIFPVFILVTPLSFALAMIFDHENFSNDIKSLITKIRAYVKKDEQKEENSAENKQLR